ncbi:hypothetical protein KEM60_00230 [Austwickia sp. TVS 96-490-7B]|nr:hypothetical protein [Austwickia sp. TVS 96-490-7B]MBW3084047.1 hypothetical protein [Austwickia sp. TVS 96-490-7B]
MGTAVVELTDLIASKYLLIGYPPGIQVIIRRKPPHSGTQLEFTNTQSY